MSQPVNGEWFRGYDTTQASTSTSAARNCKGADALWIQLEWPSQTSVSSVKFQGRVRAGTDLTTWVDIPLDRVMSTTGFTHTEGEAAVAVSISAAASLLVCISPAPGEIRLSHTRTSGGAAIGLSAYVMEMRDR